MGNVYSAQNVASYFIYELNEVHTFVNQISIQQLLKQVDELWKQVFGHSAYSETTHTLEITGYYVKEVYDAYVENASNHISVPAREWFLKYGEFQLVYRTYAIPAFSQKEELLVQKVLEAYRTVSFIDVDIAV